MSGVSPAQSCASEMAGIGADGEARRAERVADHQAVDPRHAAEDGLDALAGGPEADPGLDDRAGGEARREGEARIEHLRLAADGDAIIEAGIVLAGRAHHDAGIVERQQVMARHRQHHRPGFGVHPGQPDMDDLPLLRRDGMLEAKRSQDGAQDLRRPGARRDDDLVGFDQAGRRCRGRAGGRPAVRGSRGRAGARRPWRWPPASWPRREGARSPARRPGMWMASRSSRKGGNSRFASAALTRRTSPASGASPMRDWIRCVRRIEFRGDLRRRRARRRAGSRDQSSPRCDQAVHQTA